MTRPKGIDVSDNNGSFNWEPWRGHIQFAFIKATQGLSFQDPEFPRNWQAAKSLGLKRFAYHYAEPGSDPVGQVHNLINYVREFGVDDHDHFALDLEQSDGLPPSQVAFWAWVFSHHVNIDAHGHRLITYTYPAFADAGNLAMSSGWPLWISNTGVPVPDVPPPWQHIGWTFWQHVTNPLGQDVFNGTLQQLDEFCATDGFWHPPMV